MSQARVWVFIVASLAACGVTETGNPPADPVANPEVIREVEAPIFTPGEVSIEGGPLSVDPPEGEVVVVALDHPEREIARERIRSDGGFDQVTLRVGNGALRLWFETPPNARGERGRSRPIDFHYDEGNLVPITRALPCLEIPSDVPPGVDSIEIVNRCDDDVRFTDARWWSGRDATVTIAPLASGESITLSLPDPTSDFDILFVVTESPVAENRPVTVFAD